MVTLGAGGLVAVGVVWLLVAYAVRAGRLPARIREATDPDRTALAGLPVAAAGFAVLAMGLLAGTGMVAGGPVWVAVGLLLAVGGFAAGARLIGR